MIKNGIMPKFNGYCDKHAKCTFVYVTQDTADCFGMFLNQRFAELWNMGIRNFSPKTLGRINNGTDYMPMSDILGFVCRYNEMDYHPDVIDEAKIRLNDCTVDDKSIRTAKIRYENSYIFGDQMLFVSAICYINFTADRSLIATFPQVLVKIGCSECIRIYASTASKLQMRSLMDSMFNNRYVPVYMLENGRDFEHNASEATIPHFTDMDYDDLDDNENDVKDDADVNDEGFNSDEEDLAMVKISQARYLLRKEMFHSMIIEFIKQGHSSRGFIHRCIDDLTDRDIIQFARRDGISNSCLKELARRKKINVLNALSDLPVVERIFRKRSIIDEFIGNRDLANIIFMMDY